MVDLANLRQVADSVQKGAALIVEQLGAVNVVVSPASNPPQLVAFDAPVGTRQERAAPMMKNGKPIWPGNWFDATGYATIYTVPPNPTAAHTGSDLNLPNQGDYRAPCFAPANGTVVVAQTFPVWGWIVVIEHPLEVVTPDAPAKAWSRLAHLDACFVEAGQVVDRGDAIGLIGNAFGRYSPHLHYDIAKIDLSAKPTDWPGNDRPRVLRDYYDPLEFTRQRHHA